MTISAPRARSRACTTLFRIAAGSLIGAAAVFTLAACGDDDDGDPTQAPTSAPTTPSGSSPTTGPTQPATGTAQPTTAPTTPATNTPVPGDTEPKEAPSDPDPITGVATAIHLRLGHHPEDGGFERIVFEFDGDLRPSALVEYVDSGVSECGSGNAVELPGEAILSITMYDVNAHTPEGQPTLDGGIKEVSTPAGGSTILKGVQLCDFEAQVEWAFGLTGEQNFTVTTLENPPRIVVDIRQ